VGKAQELFQEFSVAVKANKLPTISDDEIDARCEQFAKLLGSLDAIWSNTRGMDAGLPPAKLQLEHLQKALLAGKQLWFAMRIGTLLLGKETCLFDETVQFVGNCKH